MSTSSKNDNTTDKKPVEATGFLSHLIEMRDRLLKVVIVVSIAFIALFPFAANIYDWLAAPLGRGLIIIGPVAPFLIPMKLTLMVAFFITLPYLLFQLWSFIAPGLYKHEKRLMYPLLASSVFLFYLGVMFVYYVLLPMMFKVIPQFIPESAVFQPDIAQYLDFTMMMFMAFGIGFEMPIATILLISTGMTTAEKLKKKRPYVIVGAFVVGMLLTPPDVISQIMLAIPMWILFEVGLFFSKFFKVRVKEASKAREKIDNELTEAEQKTATATAALAAEKLWEDDDYIFEDEHENVDYSSETEDNSNSSSDDELSDEEKSILNNDPIDDSLYDDYLDEEIEDELENDRKNNDNNSDDTSDKEDDFFDNNNDDFHEMDDEEMEAELDRIEAQEKVDKIVAKKAKKRAEKRAEEKAKSKAKTDKKKPK